MRYPFAIGVLLAALALGLAQVGHTQHNRENFLELVVKPSQKNYFLGEIVPIEIRIKNVGPDRLKLVGNVLPEDGLLSISISRDNKVFRKYDSGRRVDAKRNPVDLAPSESIGNLAKVLWNRKPNVSGLAPDVVKEISNEKILTDYAFSEPGDYYLKATYVIYVTAEPTFVESKPVKITIREPLGADLEVWNKIKSRGDIAYFIQEGSLPIHIHTRVERETFQREIEQIIAEYPTGFYAEGLRQSLAKFNIAEEKRKTMIEKLKVEHPQ